MASSATDAGNTEKAIRQRLIETEAVDCIVAVGNNFFYTRSLPCHLWFLDKGKSEQNKDKILMIDARNTFRKVNTTISDFSPGQLRNFSAIMAAYRGDEEAIARTRHEHQQEAVEQAKEIIEGVNRLREQCQAVLDENQNSVLDFSAASDELSHRLSINDRASHEDCASMVTAFEQPAPLLAGLMEYYKAELDTAKKSMIEAEKKSKKKNTELRKQLDAQSRLLRELASVFNAYHEEFTQSTVGEPLTDYRQSLKDWQALIENFPDDQYQDIEGLCKITGLDEVIENDYSLTPGRYVGYSIQIDPDFDYQGRMAEIHHELAGLNTAAIELMGQIQSEVRIERY